MASLGLQEAKISASTNKMGAHMTTPGHGTATDLDAEIAPLFGPDGSDLSSLTNYLAAQGLMGSGPLNARLISGGRSNLTYQLGAEGHRWILRRPPLGDVLAGAHDVGREYRVMSALRDSTVPVPAMIDHCEDVRVIGCPFYLVEEVVGTVLRTPDLVEELDERSRRQLSGNMIDALCELHEIDYQDVGLGSLGRPDGYLERQVDRWQRQYHKIKVRDLDRADAVAAALRDGMPRQLPGSLVHGDFRLDNVMVDTASKTQLVAVLDWEMATIGDPLADLATFLMFWDEVGKPFNPITGGLTAFTGFHSAREILERYASRRALDVDQIDWYLAFSQFKLAIILEQMYVRHLGGNTVGAGFEDIGTFPPDLIRQADQLLGGSL